MAGNDVRLLVDGPQTHNAMFAAMRAADDHINLQSYIISDDEVGRELSRLLRDKRSQGVRVNVLYDAMGGRDTPAEFFESLRQAGIAVCEFNPVNPLRARIWRINNRNHRKLLIVDGRVAFTGGINISGVYSAGSFGGEARTPERGWRDTHVRFEGPVVREAQTLFVSDWRSQPHCPALQDAARRGVDVRLVLPGFSDFWAPLEAGRSHYEQLLEYGVRIYERTDALLHAKTAVIDGVWSTVGSTNLDWRSFVHNYEADLVVLDEAFALQLEKLFELDVAHSREITLDAWRQRGAWQRMKEWLARQWRYWL